MQECVDKDGTWRRVATYFCRVASTSTLSDAPLRRGFEPTFRERRPHPASAADPARAPAVEPTAPLDRQGRRAAPAFFLREFPRAGRSSPRNPAALHPP